MHGANDVRFFDHFTPVYGLVVPPADPGALEMALDRTDRDVERVVDINDGSGRTTLALDVPERVVLDRSVGMLRRARGRGLDCVRDDTRKLPSAGDSLDAATVVNAFHHMPDQRGVAGETFRMLAPDGTSAVNEFDPGTFLGRELVVAERVVGFESAFATPSELMRFLKRVGFGAAVVEHGFEYTVVGRRREGR